MTPVYVQRCIWCDVVWRLLLFFIPNQIWLSMLIIHIQPLLLETDQWSDRLGIRHAWQVYVLWLGHMVLLCCLSMLNEVSWCCAHGFVMCGRQCSMLLVCGTFLQQMQLVKLSLACRFRKQQHAVAIVFVTCVSTRKGHHLKHKMDHSECWLFSDSDVQVYTFAFRCD